MCLGDGVHADKSQIVECPYYTSFSAMGFYALLLSLVIAYVSWTTINDVIDDDDDNDNYLMNIITRIECCVEMNTKVN